MCEWLSWDAQRENGCCWVTAAVSQHRYITGSFAVASGFVFAFFWIQISERRERATGTHTAAAGGEPADPWPHETLWHLFWGENFIDFKNNSRLIFWDMFVNVFLCVLQLSKTYGNIFQVFLGPRKTVVLVGYKTVKEALVNHAEEFGDRDIGPVFRIMNDEHGRILLFLMPQMNVQTVNAWNFAKQKCCTSF